MADKVATFGIKIPVETNAKESANSVDALRASILASQTAVKTYGATLRNLRGSSDEVKAAKDSLKTAINAERDAVSRNTLELGKQGKTLFEAASKTKALAKPLADLKEKTEALKGPAADLSHKFSDLKEKFTGAGAGANLAVVGFGLIAAAILAVGAAALAGAVSLAKFMLEAGSELRTMNLFSEAASGSAANAKAMGHQIEALAAKVPIARKELHEMYLDLVRNAQGSRMSGTAVTDTFNAVAQASGAMGDKVGKSIEDILTRGKLMGRMSLGVNELNGSGIQFNDVAKQLSENLKIGMKDAQNVLFMGRVKLDDGAKAVRQVIEKRFGKVNLALMLDLPKLVQKFKDNVAGLVSGLNITPILEGFAKLAALFDQNTVTGSVLKGLITDFGNALSVAFKASLPFIETFFTQVLIEALKLEIAVIRLGIWVKKTFGVDFLEGFDGANTAVMLAKVTFGAFLITILALGVAVAALVAPFVLVGLALQGLQDAGAAIYQWFAKADWSAIGTGIVDGIIGGIKAGWAKLESAVGETAATIKDKFKNMLGIHSPSTVFEEYGKQTTAGYSKGIDGGQAGASAAVSAMVSAPKVSGGGAGGGGPVSVTVSLNFPEAKDGDGVRRALNSPSFKAEFTRVLEEMLIGAGAPTQTPQGNIT